jgi:hypothetical protein
MNKMLGVYIFNSIQGIRFRRGIYKIVSVCQPVLLSDYVATCNLRICAFYVKIWTVIVVIVR